MADVTPSSGSSIDEMFASLDALLSREKTRIAADLAALAVVAERITAGVAPEPEPEATRRAGPEFRDRAPEPPAEYPILPRRTTHGGPFGASIIDRVAASVRRDSDW